MSLVTLRSVQYMKLLAVGLVDKLLFLSHCSNKTASRGRLEAGP